MAKPGSKDTPMKAAVLTVSDGCFHGRRQDLSGDAVRNALQQAGWSVVDSGLVPDEISRIRRRIEQWCRHEGLGLIVSSGGTGLGPRDVTPEAVRPLLDKEVPGLSELMRLRGLEKTDFAALSRSLAGLSNGKVVLCLPGSPKGALESLQAVLKILPHAIDIAQGRTEHKRA